MAEPLSAERARALAAAFVEAPIVSAEETHAAKAMRDALLAHADALDAGRIVLLTAEEFTQRKTQDDFDKSRALRAALERIAVAVGLTADAGHDEVADVAVEVAGERNEMRDNYLGACRTIAKMHAAATGKPAEGAVRGVVEDIEDLRAARDRLRAQRDALVSVAEPFAWDHDLLVREGLIQATYDGVWSYNVTEKLDAARAALDAISKEG